MKGLNNLSTKVYLRVNSWKESAIDSVRDFVKDEEGASDILSMMIILGVVVAIAFLFRKSLISLVQNLWNSVFTTNDVDPSTVKPSWGG